MTTARLSIADLSGTVRPDRTTGESAEELIKTLHQQAEPSLQRSLPKDALKPAESRP